MGLKIERGRNGPWDLVFGHQEGAFLNLWFSGSKAERANYQFAPSH